MKNHVRIKSEYRASTNLIFDTETLSLIDGFIPTTPSLDIIEWLFHPSIYSDSTEKRAHLLTGAYGKGKSYSVLVTINVLRSILSEKDHSNLIEKISTQRKYLSEWIDEFKSKGRRLLPVVVNGGFSSLAISLSAALSEALEKYGFSDILPESSFSKALLYLKTWEEIYPEAYEKFFTLIKDEKSIFLQKIQTHDEQSLKDFIYYYPQVSNGSEFSIISDMQVAKDYQNVSQKLVQKGYDGIFVIYDEFSKFLESKKGIMTEADIRLLQDLAEVANSSGTSGQLHLLLISHKNPSNYFTDETTVHEWDAISGRFDSKELFGDEEQEYEIIQNILDVDSNFINTWVSNNTKGLDSLKIQCVAKRLFSEESFSRLCRTCYPLHPVVTYSLPRLSERIAQNERSLFSFLLAKEKGSLSDFLAHAKNNEPLKISYLFEYFQPLFRNAPHSSILFQLDIMVRNIQQRLQGKNELAIDVSKTIAMLIALNDPEHLPPTSESVQICYSLGSKNQSSTDISEAIRLLEEYGVLKISGLDGTFLPIAIDPKFFNEIRIRKERARPKFSLGMALEKLGYRKAFYPVLYNDTHCITRYFKLVFIDGSDYLYTKRLSSNNFKDGNGTVFAILTDEKQYDQISSVVNDVKLSPLACVVVPQQGFQYEKVIDCVIELQVVAEMLSMKTLKAEDEQVLQTLEQDARYSLDILLSPVLNPSDIGVDIYCHKGKIYISKPEDFILMLSDQMESVFKNTPIINRDDLNVDTLSAPARKSRDELIRYILKNDLDGLSKLSLTGQTHSFYRISCLNNGILYEDENLKKFVITINQAKNNCKFALEQIFKYYISSAEMEKSLAPLISLLREQSGQIGMKKGPLAIFLACVCAMYPQNLIFKRKGKESAVSPQLFVAIIEAPDDFSVCIKDWSSKQQNYVEELCQYFSIDSASSQTIENLAVAIQSWWNSLPLQVKNCSGYITSEGKLDKYPKEFHKIGKVIDAFDGNSFDFVMVKIPSSIGFKGAVDKKSAETLIQIITKISFVYERNYIAIKDFILSTLKASMEDYDFVTSLHAWIDKIPSGVELHCSHSTRYVMENLRQRTADEDSVFRMICMANAGVRFSDWTEPSLNTFVNSLQNVYEDVINTSLKDNYSDNKNLVKLEIFDENEERFELNFKIAKSIELYDMIYNELEDVISEYGSSLDRPEKNKILLDLILNS